MEWDDIKLNGIRLKDSYIWNEIKRNGMDWTEYEWIVMIWIKLGWVESLSEMDWDLIWSEVEWGASMKYTSDAMIELIPEITLVLNKYCMPSSANFIPVRALGGIKAPHVTFEPSNTGKL